MTTQTKTAHSPGPWNYETDGLIGWYEILDKEEMLLAESVETETDARLMAAAPEMLEALELLHRAMIQRNMYDHERLAADQALAVIQKARGGQ